MLNRVTRLAVSSAWSAPAFFSFARTGSGLPSGRSISRLAYCIPFVDAHASINARSAILSKARLVHNSGVLRKGIIPDTADPSPRNSAPNEHVTQATEISAQEYNELADQYLDRLASRLEEMQDQKGDVDVEYSGGVLTVEFGDKGTWAFNKQAPNRQIWLSSPLTGPKRYDWVVTGESMHQKEGGGSGSWIYLRDGTSLNSVVRKELGIEFDVDVPQV